MDYENLPQPQPEKPKFPDLYFPDSQKLHTLEADMTTNPAAAKDYYSHLLNTKLSQAETACHQHLITPQALKNYQRILNGLALLYDLKEVSAPKNSNPITNCIMAVIASTDSTIYKTYDNETRLKYLVSDINLIPCIAGPPETPPAFNSEESFRINEFAKPRQTAHETLDGQDKTFRTITGPESYPLATRHLFSLLEQAAKTQPDLLESAFHEYLDCNPKINRSFGYLSLKIGLLEILNNQAYISAGIFPGITDILRDGVLKRSKNWPQFPYRIFLTQDKNFWDLPSRLENPKNSLNIPDSKQVELLSLTQKKAQAQIRSLRSRSNLVTRAVLGEQINFHQAEIVEQELQRKRNPVISKFRKDWENLFERLIPQYYEPDKKDQSPEMIQTTIRLILDYFSDRPDFPAKARLPLPDNPHAVDRLLKNPLFSWTQYIDTPPLRQAFKLLSESQPKSTYLMLKLLTQDILREFYHIHDRSISFFLSPDSPENPHAHSSQLKVLIDNLYNNSPDCVLDAGRAFTELTDSLPPRITPEISSVAPRKVLLDKLAEIISKLRFTDHLTYYQPDFAPNKKLFKSDLDFNIKRTNKKELIGTLVALGLLASAELGLLDIASNVFLLKSDNPAFLSSLFGLPDKSENFLEKPFKNQSWPDSQNSSKEKPPSDKYLTIISTPEEKIYLPFPDTSSWKSSILSKSHVAADVYDPKNPIPAYSADEMVIQYDKLDRNLFISAPQGWKFNRLFLKGQPTDTVIFENALGNVHLPIGTDSVIAILDKQNGDPDIISPASEKNAYKLTPIDQDSASILNSRLVGPLQSIHRQFITELGLETDPSRQSDIILKYLGYLKSYSDTRYYALHQVPDNLLNGENSVLSWISRNPDKGYFCATSAMAVKELLDSANISNDIQTGIMLYDRQNAYWGNIKHANNVVFLPDGQIVRIDITPPETSQTPTSDINELGFSEPDFFQLYGSELKNLALALGLTAAEIGSVILVLKKVTNKSFEKLVAGANPETFPQLTEPEKQALLVSALCLAKHTESETSPQNPTQVLDTLLNSPTELITTCKTLAQDTEFPDEFLESDPVKSFNALAQSAGPRLLHPHTPETISKGLAYGNGKITPESQIPPDFYPFHLLTRMFLEAEIASRVSHIREEFQPVADPSQEPELINQKLLTIIDSFITSHHDSPNISRIQALKQLFSP